MENYEGSALEQLGERIYLKAVEELEGRRRLDNPVTGIKVSSSSVRRSGWTSEHYLSFVHNGKECGVAHPEFSGELRGKSKRVNFTFQPVAGIRDIMDGAIMPKAQLVRWGRNSDNCNL